MLRAGSNSAWQANTVRTMRPAGLVVSTHGSAKLRKHAPTDRMRSATSSGSQVLRAKRQPGHCHHIASAKVVHSMRPISGTQVDQALGVGADAGISNVQRRVSHL